MGGVADHVMTEDTKIKVLSLSLSAVRIALGLKERIRRDAHGVSATFDCVFNFIQWSSFDIINNEIAAKKRFGQGDYILVLERAVKPEGIR